MTVGGVRVSLGSRKQRAVLAMLLINRNRVVGSDALIDAVWEQRVGREARGSLHTYVSNLRRFLNDGGLDGRTVLAAAPSGYRLSVADIDCDIGRFVGEKTAGIRAAAAGQFELASRHLSAALAEWRGRALEDLGDLEFVTSYAAALVEDEVTVHIARAEVEIACGRANDVIGALESLAAEHPYREPLWAQLIIAYYVAERQSDALDAYRRLKIALAEDLGIEPGPTIRALQERVLRQEVMDVRRAALTAASVAASTLDRRTTSTGRPAVARLHALSRGPSVDRGGHSGRQACRQRRRARRRRSQPPPRRAQRHGDDVRHHRSALCQRRVRRRPSNPRQCPAVRRGPDPDLPARVRLRDRASSLIEAPQRRRAISSHAAMIGAITVMSRRVRMISAAAPSGPPPMMTASAPSMITQSCAKLIMASTRASGSPEMTSGLMSTERIPVNVVEHP